MKKYFKNIMNTKILVSLAVTILIFIIAFVSFLYYQEKVNDISYIMPKLDYEVAPLLEDNGCLIEIFTEDENLYGAETYLQSTTCDLNIKYLDFYNSSMQDKYFNDILKQVQVTDHFQEKVLEKHEYYEYVSERETFDILVQNGGTVMHASTSVENKEKVLAIFQELGYYYTGYQNDQEYYKRIMVVTMFVDFLIIMGILIIQSKKEVN